jgi:hypothetical protein
MTEIIKAHPHLMLTGQFLAQKKLFTRQVSHLLLVLGLFLPESVVVVGPFLNNVVPL